MKRILAILLVFLLLPGEAFARSSGRSYSSGGGSSCGRSYSSGGSSSGMGKSFSSGGSHSFSSGGSSSFKSYSSGGSSGKSYSSSPASNGQSYSSSPASRSNSFGNSSFAVHATPHSSTSSSFGSDTTPQASSSKSFGKSYSSGGSSSFVGKSATSPPGGFNSALTSAGQREDSRIAYEKHYPTPAGASKTYTPSDHIRAERIRYVDENRYRNYDYRAQIFYGNFAPSVTTIIGLHS